jgi:hypothetical protein
MEFGAIKKARLYCVIEYKRGDCMLYIVRLAILGVGVILGLTACGGGSGSMVGGAGDSGLDYRQPAAIYAVGVPIVPNAPLDGNGLAFTHYDVSPALPAGLTLDSRTGVISGTPSAVTNAANYVVTATGIVRKATSRVQIEVKAAIVAPDSLSYPQQQGVFAIGTAIQPVVPVLTGGEVAQCSVAPALPAGLTLDSKTGVISGIPTAVAPMTSYTFTCSNRAGSVTSTMALSIAQSEQPPTSLTYYEPRVVYTVGSAISENWPDVVGGAVTAYSVEPPLPDGLALNEKTGRISGTPSSTQPETQYVVTGRNGAGTVQTTLKIEVLDKGLSWVPADSMKRVRVNHTATLLKNGDVLVAGGDVVGTAEWFDHLTKKWKETGPMVSARQEHTATLLKDGTVLVAGGAFAGVPLNSAELYHPDSHTWTPTAPMQRARRGHAAVRLENDEVLVTGGRGEASAEIYNSDTGQWRNAPDMSAARWGHIAVLLSNKKVLVAGGIDSLARKVLNTAELYDPDNNKWTNTATTMKSPRAGHVAALVAGGKVLLAGGFSNLQLQISNKSAELYDSFMDQWVPAGSMNDPRIDFTAVTLPNGKVLVAGGRGLEPPISGTSELYDLASDRWTLTGSMAQTRTLHSMTLLDNRVLVCGGDFAHSECEMSQ